MFKLLSTYEFFLHVSEQKKLIRIEIFKTIDGADLYRARVWSKSTYNVYPTELNTSQNGDDLHRLHSSDDFNNDITSSIADDESIMFGGTYCDEGAFLDSLLERVEKFFPGAIQK